MTWFVLICLNVVFNLFADSIRRVTGGNFQQIQERAVEVQFVSYFATANCTFFRNCYFVRHSRALGKKWVL